jgi:uncharacterized protein (DUF927 family)
MPETIDVLNGYLESAAALEPGDIGGADELLHEAAACEPQLIAEQGDELVAAIHRSIKGDIQSLKQTWVRAVTAAFRAEKSGKRAIEKLIEGDLDPFIARCAEHEGFPFAEDAYVALVALHEEKRPDYERLLARLKAETKVRATDLDREVKKRVKVAEKTEKEEEAAEFVYSMTERGLFAKDELNHFTYISQPFEALGHCRSVPDARGRSTDWGLLIRFRDIDGVTCDEIVSAGRLHGDLAALCSDLALAGMKIETEERPRRLFRRYLNHFSSDDRVTLVKRTGWHMLGSQDVFVLPDKTISAGPLPEKVVLTAASGDRTYEASGTLEQWKASVGTLARDHFLPRLAVSTALASPLLYLVGGIEGGGVHFYGSSGTGKTTVTRMGASCWRCGADLPTWRSTANGLEGESARASGIGFVLNEMGEATSPSEVGRVVYMITNAVGKIRMSRNINLRDPLTWLLLFLSSGEVSLETMLAEGGQRPKPGQLVRLLDVRADRPNGAFDDLGEAEPHLYAQQCERAAETHFGTAGPEFVKQLLERKTTSESIRERIEALVGKWLPDGTVGAGQPARAATRLALIALAGELATEFDILPWPKGHAITAAEWAFGQWYAARGGHSTYERRQAIAQVKHFIENYGQSRFDLFEIADANKTVQDMEKRSSIRVGYRKGVGADQRWLVSTQAWEADVCKDLDHVLAAKALGDEGMLEPGDGNHLSKQVRIGGLKPRFYVLTPKLLEWDE